ncbi:hypothetical protein ABVT39_006555 [Epinephelus coioides]
MQLWKCADSFGEIKLNVLDRSFVPGSPEVSKTLSKRKMDDLLECTSSVFQCTNANLVCVRGCLDCAASVSSVDAEMFERSSDKW